LPLKFRERPGVNLRSLNLSVDEWKVISFINPKNTIHQIARATNKNDLEIRRIVYSFIQAGLVEMVRPQGRPIQRPVDPDPQVPRPKPQLQQAEPQLQHTEPAPLIQPRISLPQNNKPEFKSLINRIITRIRSI
jgi:hypothetical protein